MTYLFRSLFVFGLLLLCSQPLLAQKYYNVREIDQAKAEARAKHLPIAWLSSPMVYLGSDYANDKPGSPADLTAVALRALQGQTVIIFQDADNDLPNIPQNIADRIETKDEGDGLPNGWHYTAPKILYLDPDLKTFLGCTLAPQVRADREAAITLALHRIRNDASAQALIQANAAPAAAASASNASAPVKTSTNALATVASMSTSGTLFIGVIGVLVVVIGALGFVAWRKRA